MKVDFYLFSIKKIQPKLSIRFVCVCVSEKD